MNELLEQLQARAGLSKEQAEKVLPVVADFLQKHLSTEQIQSIAGKVGLGDMAEKLPEGLGDKVAGFLRKRD